MADLRFRPLEHPSDVGIIAYGKNQREIFQNAAYGMFSLIADLDQVNLQQSLQIKVKGDDSDSLLINWLNELLFYHDSQTLLLKEFKINKLTKTHLEAEARGERIDLEKHSVYKSIKAATYNQLQISKNKATIVFDV